MAKLKIGDRVTIPNDSRVYEVLKVDSDMAGGYVLLKLWHTDRKAEWYPSDHCQKVEPCNL